MAEGNCGGSQSNKTHHTRTLSLPNPLRLIQMSENQRSLDDAFSGDEDDRPRNFLDNLIAIGQAAVENLQERNTDEEFGDENQGLSATQEPEAIIEEDSETNVVMETEVIEPQPVTTPPKEHEIIESDPDGILNYNVACPVCLENYYRPHRCVPCKHTFCEPCLCKMRRADRNTVTKCPLCREKIKKCIFDSALSSSVASSFPEVYQARHKLEKKQKHKLPPLPGVPVTVDKYAKNMLATWSAVCGVVLFMMFVFTLFASLVGFLLWYVMEVMLDVVGELYIEISDFFSFSWQALIILYIEGKVPQEIKEILSGSFGRIGNTMSRMVNRTKAFFTDGEVPPPPTQVLLFTGYKQPTLNNSDTEVIAKVTQVNVGNYVVLVGLVTYLMYRIARYFQNGQQQELPHPQRLE